MLRTPTPSKEQGEEEKEEVEEKGAVFSRESITGERKHAHTHNFSVVGLNWLILIILDVHCQ